MNLISHIKSLEKQLLLSPVRESAAMVGDLLADDFVEFGSSGRVWNKQEIVAALQTESSSRRVMSDFRATVLATDVVLVTYRVARYEEGSLAPVRSLRSSLWKFDGRWRMAFHQGTPEARSTEA